MNTIKPVGVGVTVKSGEAAKRLGVHLSTLHHWEQRGLIPEAKRTPMGQRVYSESDINEIKNLLPEIVRQNSENQRNGLLAMQENGRRRIRP